MHFKVNCSSKTAFLCFDFRGIEIFGELTKMTNSSSNVHFKRQDCLRQIFRQSRQGVCFYSRVELRNTKLVRTILSDIARILRKKDERFGKIYTKCTGLTTFTVFWEIKLGEEKPSMYIHRGGISVTSIGLEAESEALWRDEISKLEGVNYLNAKAVNVLLHMTMSKVLKEYSRSSQWKERMEEMNLHSIGLEEVCNLHLFFENELKSKKKELVIKLRPTIKLQEHCKPYAKQYFGENITHLIAQPKHTSTRIHPSLQWTSSYHEQELVTMTTFPTKMTIESFYGALLMITTDDVMKLLPRDLVLHVYLETVHHMNRWLEMNFGGGQRFGESDQDAMMDNFFQNLRQKLESHFVANHFNPEINLLELHGIDYNQTMLVINKLKAILRGNCECCRGSLEKTLHQFQNKSKKGRKKGSVEHSGP